MIVMMIMIMMIQFVMTLMHAIIIAIANEIVPLFFSTYFLQLNEQILDFHLEFSVTKYRTLYFSKTQTCPYGWNRLFMNCAIFAFKIKIEHLDSKFV